MSNQIGPAGAAAMLAWNSDSCPACGEPVMAVEVQNMRVASVVPDVVSYPVCESCQDKLDNGDMAAFGEVVRAAETAIEAAILAADIASIAKAREEGDLVSLVH